MKIGDILRVEIIGLDHHGRGIAKDNDKVIFIENALPDEIVNIKIIKIKKNYSEGIVDSFIKTSERRAKPICPYYYECGGCDLMHITLEEQLLYKQNKINEIISKFTKLDTKIIEPIISNNAYNYRNKVTFQIDKKLGFYKKNSHDIIDIDYCYITDETINKILKIIRKINYQNFNQIIIRRGTKTDEVMIIFAGAKLESKANIIKLFEKDVTSIIWKDKNKYITIYGNNYIKERMNDYEFVISPESFFQVNTDVAIKMYDKVIEYAALNKDDRVLDLYCGTGTIGIYLSKYVDRVIGVEINKYAIENANLNKIINKTTNIEFYLGDVTEVLKQLAFNPTVVVVDPPRSGLDKDGISTILKMEPSKIVYISCDPITLARDLNLLSEKYDIKKITPFDMFPNTYHVETIVLLSKSK